MGLSSEFEQNLELDLQRESQIAFVNRLVFNQLGMVTQLGHEDVGADDLIMWAFLETELETTASAECGCQTGIVCEQI